MKFENHQCSNGLTILGETNPEARAAAVGFFVRTGSRDETPEESGVSHFLEHMVFKGTRKRTADQVNKDFDRIGANYNAYTSEENTVFHASTLPEYHSQATDILADILHPALRAADFETEKKVIIEEIGMYEDNPGWKVFDHARKNFFADHPLGNSVLGSVSSIQNMRRDQMTAYFHRRYAPSNITVAAAGNFNWESFHKQVEKLCSGWKPGSTRRDQIRQTSGAAAFSLLKKESVKQQNLVLISPGPPAASPLRYAACLLSLVLGDGSGSRFFWTLVDNGLADSADCAFHEYEGTGAFYSSFSFEPANTQKILDIAMAQIRAVVEKGITDEELGQAKSKVLSRLVRGSEKTGNRLQDIGMSWVYLRKYISIDETIQNFDKVSQRQIQQVLERYPILHVTTTTLGPLGKLKAPVVANGKKTV
ncbi:MAG: insulinase family protein [Gemmataceae bacterium]|nr:insulinase family protein [Gemmataceae bacterium]